MKNLDKTLIPTTIHGAACVSHDPHQTFKRTAGFPYSTMAALLRGSLRLTIANGDSVVVASPFLVWIEPGVAYALRSGGTRGWQECWLILSIDALHLRPLLEWPTLLAGIRGLTLDSARTVSSRAWERELMATLVSIPQLLSCAHPCRAELAVNAWQRAMLVSQGLGGGSGRVVIPPQLQTALEIMSRDLAQAHTVASLARSVHQSPSHFTALCRRHLGNPPMRLLRQRRIERSQALLLGTSWPIKAISHAVGFPDPFHFSSCFRSLVGCSPRAFRSGTRYD
jgi:AraC-like DNA-binding protein